MQLFAQIHEICFYGKGGYDWHTVYDMPLWLRRFTHSKMVEHYEEEKKAYNKASGKGSSTSRSLTTDGKVTAPEFLKGNSPPKSHTKSVPNYSTKASKK